MSDHRADQIVMTIHAGPEAPSEARRAVEDVLKGNGRLDDALLVTSELVSNTVLHSGIDDGEPIRLVVSRRSGRIRIGMSHARAGDRRSPRRARHGKGYGLSIVGQIVERWDVEHRGSTTETWFEL